jgi:tyrosyl-tRNA synthetase
MKEIVQPHRQSAAPPLLDVLYERGFIQQVSDEAGLRAALARPDRPLTLYCGYDPSSPSLTVGNLLTIMLLAHFQRHGHRPIVVAGGGTGLIGDPSGKTSQRRMLTAQEIQRNLEGQRLQFSRYLDFNEDRALLLNNADWLLPLRYIEFLRDIGRHFSVNQMLAAEAYRTRLDTGLSFIEFNYMLLQSYDFLHLYQQVGCLLQVGGSDQWANCLAGADLIRRVEGGEAYVLVTPLLTTASGQKMGKTEAGAIWLDPARTSPYEFYQYWINTDDRDVERFLALFTFLPMEEVHDLGRVAGAEIRGAKEVLAFEATKLTHGEDEARKAQAASRRLFSSTRSAAEQTTTSHPLKEIDADTWNRLFGDVPTTSIPRERIRGGLSLVDLLAEAGLASSKSEARRLVQQGGAYVNDQRVTAVEATVDESDLRDGRLLLRSGKKRYHVVLAE